MVEVVGKDTRGFSVSSLSESPEDRRSSWSLGPEKMLERATSEGLMVPLSHYTIYVYGTGHFLARVSWESHRSVIVITKRRFHIDSDCSGPIR